MAKTSSDTRVVDASSVQLVIRGIVTLALMGFVVGGWAWWHYVHNNPKQVFWHAIDNALHTSTFTRRTQITTNGQKIDQQNYITTGPEQLTHGTNEVTQVGNSGFRVLTEVAGIPTTDYVKYNIVKTDQPRGAPQQNFSSIIGVWGMVESTDKNTTDSQLYSQSVLTVLPFGNLNLAKRKALIKVIQDNKVYDVDFGSTVRKLDTGRPTYTYNVTVSAEAYVTMLKEYAGLVGLTQLEQTNPAVYKDTPPLKFKFTIDVWTGQIKSISYVNSSREETYGSFGARPKYNGLPKNAIPIEELKQRVQAIE